MMIQNEIERELRRIGALSDVAFTVDEQFEPEAGRLLKVEIGDADWHLYPEKFLELLEDVPADAGGEAVKSAIERDAVVVWHGPAPKDSRDSDGM